MDDFDEQDDDDKLDERLGFTSVPESKRQRHKAIEQKRRDRTKDLLQQLQKLVSVYALVCVFRCMRL